MATKVEGVPYTRNPEMAGFTEGWFETKDHIKLRVLHKGEGFPLILVHGGFDDADTWMLNAPEYAKQYAVYALDLRGNGYSDAHNRGAHIHRLGADIHEFIEYLGEPKVDLMGWSMGCSVIWSYIELFGLDRVHKLVFQDEAPVLVSNPTWDREEVLRTGSNPCDHWLVVNAVKKYGPAWVAGGSPLVDAMNACFRRGIGMYTEEEYKALPDNYYEKYSKRPAPPEYQNDFYSRLIHDHLMLDWRDIFPQITAPTLLISGDTGLATTVECCKWMSEQMPNCKWIRFNDIHDMNQTSYVEFNRVVLDFLNN